MIILSDFAYFRFVSHNPLTDEEKKIKKKLLQLQKKFWTQRVWNVTQQFQKFQRRL